MLEEHNQGELPKGGKHLLPPVRLYARKHVSNSTMQKILNFAKDKKHQLQQQIHQQEYNPLEVDLKYLQSGPFDEIKTQVKSYSNPAIEEEMLARGSIDEWVETEPSKKSRLFTKDFHLESTHIDVTRSRIRSALRDEGSDNPLAYKRYKKCATEPPQHESTPVRRKIQTRNQKRYDYTGRTIEED